MDTLIVRKISSETFFSNRRQVGVIVGIKWANGHAPDYGSFNQLAVGRLDLVEVVETRVALIYSKRQAVGIAKDNPRVGIESPRTIAGLDDKAVPDFSSHFTSSRTGNSPPNEQRFVYTSCSFN
jgi:hypothetical protein